MERQKQRKLETAAELARQAEDAPGLPQARTALTEQSEYETGPSLEQMLSHANLQKAWRQVKAKHDSSEYAEPPYTGPYVRWCGRGGQ